MPAQGKLSAGAVECSHSTKMSKSVETTAMPATPIGIKKSVLDLEKISLNSYMAKLVEFAAMV